MNSEKNIVKPHNKLGMGVAANVATGLFLFFIAVQLLVAIGILPASILWGGGQDELTLGLRFASVGASLVLALFIYLIRSRAGLISGRPPSPFIRISAWVVTGYMALNVLGNFVSVNPIEKMVFGPLALILALACLIVTTSR